MTNDTRHDHDRLRTESTPQSMWDGKAATQGRGARPLALRDVLSKSRRAALSLRQHETRCRDVEDVFQIRAREP